MIHDQQILDRIETEIRIQSHPMHPNVLEVVDETSADNGCDRMVTLSGSLMTNASQSLSSSDSNCPPRSSASINSSSSTSQPEPPRIKDEAAVARFFSGLEDAVQSQFQLVPPICTLRLSPTNQKTKCAVAHILENGDMCLEFFWLCRGKLRVCRGILISPDGLMIQIYKLDSPLDPSLKPIPPSSSLGLCKKFLYSKLPQKYWKQYEHAFRFVDVLRSETAKVILYSDQAKAKLMENMPNPNLEVCFYDGSKFKVSTQETKIIHADGSSLIIESTGSFVRQMLKTQKMWHHVQMLHSVCKDVDNFFTEKVSNRISCFPIVIRGTRSASAMMSQKIETNKYVDAKDSQPSPSQQPVPNYFPASERMLHDMYGSTATSRHQLRSTSVGSSATLRQQLRLSSPTSHSEAGVEGSNMNEPSLHSHSEAEVEGGNPDKPTLHSHSQATVEGGILNEPDWLKELKYLKYVYPKFL